MVGGITRGQVAATFPFKGWVVGVFWHGALLLPARTMPKWDGGELSLEYALCVYKTFPDDVLTTL